MRKFVVVATVAGAMLVSGCGKSGFDRARPDEFAVARQAPLVIPPDFALIPPQPGAARTQGANPQALALDALFGAAPRSAAETAVVDQAGGAGAVAPGIRSAVGDPQTNVIEKGQTTRDIVAAPEGDGQGARAVAGAGTPAAAAPVTAPTPAATPTP